MKGSAQEGRGHVSLLTEAVAYVGAVLVLAGGGAAVGQRWDDLTDWGHVGVFVGAAAFFLLVGAVVRAVPDAAVQRLVGVVWSLSVAGVGGAVGLATHEVYHHTGSATALAVGVGVTLYALLLWSVRRRALQQVAVFVGLVVTVCAGIVNIAGDGATALSFSLALWGLGLAWAVLGWQRYLEPMWVAVPLGVVLALYAPTLAVADHGWVLAMGIVTSAAVMAASVPMRNVVLLALGTVATFGYVTATVLRYFRESLGVPAALAVTGLLILCLAVVSARLMRATRPPRSHRPDVPGPARHDTAGHDHDLPKVS